MIFRFAPPGLAEECAQLFPNKRSILTLSTGFLWTAFDRAICAHMRGDDDLAYFTALTLTQAQKIYETEAKARGIPIQQGSRQNGSTQILNLTSNFSTLFRHCFKTKSGGITQYFPCVTRQPSQTKRKELWR